MVAADRPEPSVPDSVTPVGEDRFVVRFTAGKGLRDKLEEAQSLLSHSVPDGNLGEVFERALDALIEKTRKRRYAETAEPRPGRPSGRRTRHVPAEVRREVAQRDQGRCTFVGQNGRRCGARAFVELHHDDPYGKGGEHSAANVQVTCSAHNRLLAEADYGAEHIAAAVGRLSSKRVDPPLPEPAADPQPPIAEASTPLSSKRVGRETEAATAMRAQVVSALAKLGFHAAEAKRAVAAAAATERDDARLEDLIRDALRQLA